MGVKNKKQQSGGVFIVPRHHAAIAYEAPELAYEAPELAYEAPCSYSLRRTSNSLLVQVEDFLHVAEQC